MLAKYSAFKFWNTYSRTLSWGSSVSIVSDYRLEDCAIEVQSPAEAKGFFL
jgi:hypothetical protein